MTGIAPESRGEQARAAILVGRRSRLGDLGHAGRIINEVVKHARQRHGLRRADAHVQRERRQGRLQLLRAEGSPDLRAAARLPHLNQIGAQVNGLIVTWTISGTSNGDAAIVGVSIDGGAEQLFPQGSARRLLVHRTSPVRRLQHAHQHPGPALRRHPAGRGEAVVYGQTESGIRRRRRSRSARAPACNDAHDEPDTDVPTPDVTTDPSVRRTTALRARATSCTSTTSRLTGRTSSAR